VTFPRDKVCGDGLTPRAVKQLIRVKNRASTHHAEIGVVGQLGPGKNEGGDTSTVDPQPLMSLIRSSISAAAFAASGPPMAPSIPPPLSSRLMATLRASA
jgi:hypothetical protein